MQSKLIPFRIVKFQRIQRKYRFNSKELDFEIMHLFKNTHQAEARPSWARSCANVSSLLLDEKPLSYILKSHHFLSGKLIIYPKVLIPRSETEEYVSVLIDVIKKFAPQLQSPIKILDLCSGSGSISIALASNLSNITVTAVDKSLRSCRNVLLNISRNEDLLKELGNKIYVERLDIFADNLASSLRNDFDIIVSNPPYIPSNLKCKVDKNVKKFEEHSALFPHTCIRSGTVFHSRIIQLSKSLLRQSLVQFPIPKIVLEIYGSNQVYPLQNVMKNYTFKSLRFFKDMNRRTRSLWIY